MAIPKKIHYCWFGGNPLPKLAKKCIKSWKKYCKDYEIVEWNENTFDLSSAPLYVRQAYEAKKWAFVSDYVRLYAMVTQGGIYMDTDVEVIKKIDDFLINQAFSGFENEKEIPTGIMACEKDFPLFCEFLRYYDTATFIKEDGSYNLTTNVTIMTEICLKYGLQQNNTLQCVEGLTLYPKDYFCPKSYVTEKINKTKNTVTIHHFSASWRPNEQIEAAKARRKQLKLVNRKHFWKTLPNRIIMAILGKKNYEKTKTKLRRK